MSDLETIYLALREHKIIEFTYFGESQSVEPHQVGTNRDGEMTLLGWQHANRRSVNASAGWVTYVVELMRDLAMSDWQFYNPRPTFMPGPNRRIVHVKREIQRFHTAPSDECEDFE